MAASRLSAGTPRKAAPELRCTLALLLARISEQRVPKIGQLRLFLACSEQAQFICQFGNVASSVSPRTPNNSCLRNVEFGNHYSDCHSSVACFTPGARLNCKRALVQGPSRHQARASFGGTLAAKQASPYVVGQYSSMNEGLLHRAKHCEKRAKQS